MNKNNLFKASLLTTALVSSSAFAHVNISADQCDIELNYDLSISPQHIRIIENDQTMVDIYKDKVLFVKGDQIELTPEQQELVTSYAGHIRESVPEVAMIATEAVGVAYQGISAAMGSHVDLTGTQEKFAEIEKKITDKFNNDKGNYHFSHGNFQMNAESEEVEMMVEGIVKEMIPKLVGSIMMNIGSAMAGGEASIDDLENLGDRIEKEVEQRAQAIEEKADAFCRRLKQVEKMEKELVAQNKHFAYFDLLEIN